MGAALTLSAASSGCAHRPAPGRRSAPAWPPAYAESCRPPASARRPTGSSSGAGAWSVEGRTAAGDELHRDLDADGHPGYLATARMLGEAGLLLAEPGVTPERAGGLTPALALGTGSIDRFERARLRFRLG